MTVIISTNTQQKHFNKNYIKIGSALDSDFSMNIGVDFQLILQYNESRRAYTLTNTLANNCFTVKNNPLPLRCLIRTGAKIDILNSNLSITIKIVEDKEELNEISESNYSAAENNKFTVGFNGKIVQNEFNIANKEKMFINEQAQNSLSQQITENIPEYVISTEKTPLEKSRVNLEKARTTVIKEVGFIVNDLKKRLYINSLGSAILHLAMLFNSFIIAFGVANFLTGLKIEQAQNFINLPINVKITLLFTGIIYGICLVLKQGAFLWYENKIRPNKTGKSTQSIMLTVSAIAFSSFYIINLLYYVTLNPMFGVFISLFFVGLAAILACANGYFKFTLHLMSYELDKYEYREDFEAIMTDYRYWVSQFINNLSKNKIENIKDKVFNLQIKSWGEIGLGILTAPFLAYGVSNTLAMCFPEAAGWLRISGLRFSPIFLVLTSFMIIFAFFSFVNAFLSIRKIQASNVIKMDGFSDYMIHGVDIYGVQGIQKLETEKKRCFTIAMAIVLIEFTMNTSYFMNEIGGDLQSILLSIIAALVPTALLIAETYMLSQTKFDIYACESLLDKKE